MAKQRWVNVRYLMLLPYRTLNTKRSGNGLFARQQMIIDADHVDCRK